MSEGRDSENLEKFVHVTLGYLELVGFVFPMEGGIFLSLGAAGVDSLMDVFFGGGKSGEVRAIVAVGDAVVKALVAMAKEIEEALWKSFEGQYLAKVNGAADSLHGLYAALLDGKVTELNMAPELAEDWKKRFDQAKAMTGPGTPLLEAMAWIQGPDNAKHRHQLTPLFLLTASIYLNYCKVSLMFEQVAITRDFHRELEAWKKAHPDGKDDGSRPVQPECSPVTLKDSPYWRDLSEHAATWAEEARDAVDSIKGRLADLEAAEKERADDFSFSLEKRTVDGEIVEGWVYKDARLDYTSRELGSEDAAEMAMLIARGKAVTEVRERLLDQYELRYVIAGSVPDLEELCDKLEEAKQAYS